MHAALRTCLVLALAGVLAACGGGGGELAWRDLRITVPDGWVVFEEETSRLSLSNQRIGAGVTEEERPDGDVVAMFFTHRDGASPDEWRRQIAASGATLEVDAPTEVGGVPATRLQFLTPAEGGAAARRELVVVIPAREVELLAQPVPAPGSTDGPEVFDRALSAFDEVLASASWGAPFEPDEP